MYHLELSRPDSGSVWSSDRCQTPLSLVLTVPWGKLSVLFCHCNLIRATKGHSPLWQVFLISAFGRKSWCLNSFPLRRLLGSSCQYIQSLPKSLQTEHTSLLNCSVVVFFFNVNCILFSKVKACLNSYIYIKVLFQYDLLCFSLNKKFYHARHKIIGFV